MTWQGLKINTEDIFFLKGQNGSISQCEIILQVCIVAYISFLSKTMSAFYIAYIEMHFRFHLIMKANTMNPDQTAPLGLIGIGLDKQTILA